jgi:MYXO-CTERM domain-containing protein
MTRSLALLALLLPTSSLADGPLEAAAKKGDYEDFFEGSMDQAELWLPGGEAAVLHLDLDLGQVSATLPEPALHSDALAAVALVPAWLQPRLALTLSKLEEGRQQEIAALLSEYANHVALDELAYSIAATSPEELSMSWQYALLDVLEANALAIYEIDPYVSFADLVELDDGSTSVEYHHDDGSGLQSYTIDKDIYYRHVVNPKLDMELPLFMNPETYSIDDPPGGVHWRDWFFFSALEDGTWDYRTHWLEETPYAVTDDDLVDLEAVGWLTGFTVDPIVVVQDGAGQPLLVEVDWGKGSVLATTIDLEAAHLDSHDFAANLLEYVQRRDVLEADEATLVLGDGSEAGAEYVVHLEAEVLPYEVWDLNDGAPDLEGYSKVIVPMGLIIEAYETLYEDKSAEALEAFVSGGGTLLLQADPVLGDSYDYPCGVSGIVDEVSEASFLGHPVLGESVEGIDSLWDGVRYDGLSGERALGEALSAVDAIGWFVTQNMFDNVSEYSASHSDYGGERSVWPQRIMNNHFGNCGECQDMITAAARACLIPTMNVWSMEDHVWNEFYFEDGWHAWQVDWSDGATRIDNGGVGADSTYGGGKEVSAIMGFHENGYVADEHVALYTDTITANVTVTDADGAPVPGAMVLVAVENYYYDQYMDQAAWLHTDQAGQVEITLGDNRNFWFIAAADLGGQEIWSPYSIADIQSGSYPNWFLTSEGGDPVIAAEDAVAGSSHDVALQLNGQVWAPVVSDTSLSGADGDVAITVDLALHGSLLDVRAGHTYLGWYSELGYAYGGGMIEPVDELGTVDAYLVDADNLALFEAGEDFSALDRAEGVSTGAVELGAATSGGELYVILSNARSLRHAHHGTISASFSGGAGWSEDEGGCGCTSQPRRTPAALLGLLAVLGLAVRRRRG